MKILIARIVAYTLLTAALLLVIGSIAGCNQIATVEKSAAAGGSGGFDTVHGGLPANRFVHEKPLPPPP